MDVVAYIKGHVPDVCYLRVHLARILGQNLEFDGKLGGQSEVSVSLLFC